MGPHLRISPWMPIIRRCAPMVATSSNLRILWNVSRFRRVPRGHLRILRIPDGNSKKRPLGWYIFEFSNSLECITSSACATWPSSNSGNSRGQSKMCPYGCCVFEFSNSLECMAFWPCPLGPSSNSSNYHGNSTMRRPQTQNWAFGQGQTRGKRLWGEKRL